MSRKAALAPLTDLLVDLYPTEQSSRRVVDEAGLPHGRIAFQDAAIDNWHAILLEADRRGKVRAVVEVASEEYAERAEELAAALDAYEAAPEEPDEPEDPGPPEPEDPGPPEDEPKPPDPPPMPPGGVYRRNAILALILTVTLPIWFYLHLYPLLERSLAIGTLGAGLAAGLAAAWKLFRSLLDRGDQKSRVDRVLGHPGAVWPLLFLTTAAVFLAAFTSSIYVILDDPALNTLAVTVKTADGEPFAPRPLLKVGPGETLDGGPIFFLLPGKALHLEVESPAGFELRTEVHTPAPWRRLELRASRHVRPRSLRIVRVAPSSAVLALLPEPDALDPKSPYDLQVFVDGRMTAFLLDVRHGVVWLGASEAILEARRRAESADARRQSLEGCVSPFESEDDMIRRWNANPQILPTAELPAEGELEIRLVRAPTDADARPDDEGTPRNRAMIKSRVEEKIQSLSVDHVDSLCLQRVLQ